MAGGVALWQGSFLKRKEREAQGGREQDRAGGRGKEEGRSRDLVYNIPTHQFSLTLSFACMGTQVFECMWKSEGYVWVFLNVL